MTNTPSPDRELIERWRSKAGKLENGDEFFADEISSEFLLGALRLESLLSDRARLIELLQRVEPHLDAILCYASTMEEHEPNRLAYDIGAALKDEGAA